MTIKNFKIGTRLGAGFALVLFLLSVIAGLGVWRLQNVGDATNEMARQALVKERLAADWLVATSTRPPASLTRLMAARAPGIQTSFAGS